jgi:hypothetical protein
VTIQDRLDTLYLCRLCKPKAERALYRLLRQHRIRSIVELGLETHERCLRLIRLAKRCSPQDEVRYSSVDLFEARPAHLPHLTLKQTHQLLAASGATVRLIPGDAWTGLARSANQLTGTQLLLISPDHEPGTLAEAWFYVPRMLAASAIVLQATRGANGLEFQRLSPDEIQARAAAVGRTRRAA